MNNLLIFIFIGDIFEKDKIKINILNRNFLYIVDYTVSELKTKKSYYNLPEVKFKKAVART